MNKYGQVFDHAMLEELLAEAAASPRRRANRNLHPTLDDPVQRFFNAMQPDSYVRPHRHIDPARWECFLVLHGRIAILVFADDGTVLVRHELGAGQDSFGIELVAGAWHALVALEPTVMFELKQGPYAALTDKDFAGWAPREGEAGCAALLEWYRNAGVGMRYGN